MSNGVLNLRLIGRFGNQLFQYAYARALSERDGLELRTDPWIGQQIFEISDPPISGGHVFEAGYCQNQECMIYTRAQARDWFTLKQRPCIGLKLHETRPKDDYLVAHRRVGDYASCGYVVVSKESYQRAAVKFEYDPDKIRWVSDETPGVHESFPPPLDFLPDFYRLMCAPMLFRGNSSFSWWAATLGHGEVFSPVIRGFEGGKEQDVPFVRGNSPRLADLPCVTDLYLPE